MPTAQLSDQPSMTARLRYSLRRVQAPFRSELEGLSLSSTSSRNSLSSGTASTVATDISQDDDYDEIEDLRVLSSPADMQHSWSSREEEVRRDFLNTLGEEPSLSGHKYMLRLRFAGKSGESWRPCVLVRTRSAKTKLTLASYLLTGPPVLRRLVECGLDIHIVHDRFGLSSSAEDVENDTCDQTVLKAWLDSDIPTNGARLVVEHARTRKYSVAVGGGVLHVGGKTILLTTQHPFELDEENDDKSYCDMSPGFESTHTIDGAISVYHEDLEDDTVRLDCADAALDHFISSFDGVETMGASSGDILSSSNHHSPLKHMFAMVKDKVIQAKYKHDAKDKTLVPQTSLTSWNAQPRKDKINSLSERIPARVLYTGAELDWTALELIPKRDEQHPHLWQPNQIGGHVIDTVLDTRVCTPISVTLGTPDGEISGLLLPEIVFFHVGGRNLELQVVRLDKPLQRGTSGSWVTHCNQFCGMVVAISDDLPEAFILPAGLLVSDMERICGAEVMLPTRSNHVDLSSSVSFTEPNLALHHDEVEGTSQIHPVLIDPSTQYPCECFQPHFPFARACNSRQSHTIPSMLQNEPMLLDSGPQAGQSCHDLHHEKRVLYVEDHRRLESMSCISQLTQEHDGSVQQERTQEANDSAMFTSFTLDKKFDLPFNFSATDHVCTRCETDSGVTEQGRQWLLDDTRFQAWRNSTDGGLFWIRGKPGLGKSTFVSYLTQGSEPRVGKLTPQFRMTRSTVRPSKMLASVLRLSLYQEYQTAFPGLLRVLSQLFCKKQVLSEVRHQLADRDNGKLLMAFDNVDDKPRTLMLSVDADGNTYENLEHGMSVFLQADETITLSQFFETRSSLHLSGRQMSALWDQLAGLAQAVNRVHSCEFPQRGSIPEDISRLSRHHDIKPENILVLNTPSKRDCFMLADLDVFEPKQCGPTELKLGRKEIDRPFDIWSLGCVFLEIIVWALDGGTPAKKGVMENSEFRKYLVQRTRKRVKGLIELECFMDLIESMTQSDSHRRPSAEEVAQWISEKSIPELRERLESDEDFYVKWFAKESPFQARETIQAELVDQKPSKVRRLRSRVPKFCKIVTKSAPAQQHTDVVGGISTKYDPATQPKPMMQSQL